MRCFDTSFVWEAPNSRMKAYHDCDTLTIHTIIVYWGFQQVSIFFKPETSLSATVFTVFDELQQDA